MFRPLSEAFVRRSWYSVLLVHDTMERRRVKKVVAYVAQLVAALIMVHGLLSFLSDLSPSKRLFFVAHHRLRPADNMVLLSCVFGENGFVVFY